MNATTNTNLISITEHIGDIFDAPDNTLIIHSCNCQGNWGAGIALAFKYKYPGAFNIYNNECITHKLSNGKSVLPGSSLLVHPEQTLGRHHFIGCLFTSNGYGRNKDSPDTILRRTSVAIEQLLSQVSTISKDTTIYEIRMCKINSGYFNVPWISTRQALEDIASSNIGRSFNIKVYSI